MYNAPIGRKTNSKSMTCSIAFWRVRARTRLPPNNEAHSPIAIVEQAPRRQPKRVSTAAWTPLSPKAPVLEQLRPRGRDRKDMSPTFFSGGAPRKPRPRSTDCNPLSLSANDVARREPREKNPMSLSIRRIVTGHDQNGRAIVSIDETVKNVVQARPGAEAAVIWTSEGFPADNDGAGDAATRKVGTTLENGTVFRVVSF